jgi:hypothetical protein
MHLEIFKVTQAQGSILDKKTKGAVIEGLKDEFWI